MLSAIVLKLKPIVEDHLPLSHGTFAYAAALELFLRKDETLAKALHEAKTYKPLTVSPLLNADVKSGGNFILSPEEIYTWRLTGLTQEVSEHLIQFAPEIGGVRIGNAVFSIVDVAKTSKDHPDAGQETYENLWEKWGKSEPPKSVTLCFLTPTTFRVGRFEHPFPTPRLVFGSILDTWDHFSPNRIGQIRDLVEECIVLTNWKGETRRVEMGSHRTVGFVGKFTYRVLEESSEIRRLVGLLAEFSFYSGAGWQTTHGLGQVRPVL